MCFPAMRVPAQCLKSIFFRNRGRRKEIVSLSYETFSSYSRRSSRYANLLRSIRAFARDGGLHIYICNENNKVNK